MAAARAQIELLGAALDQYRLDIGSYPNAGQGLDALNRNPNVNNWNGPYLKKAVPKDPRGNQYKYRCCPGQNGEDDLWSEGADGAPGGDGENPDHTSSDSTQKPNPGGSPSSGCASPCWASRPQRAPAA